MPLALVALAWILVMTGIKGNYSDVGAAFEQDVIGNGTSTGFLSWLIGLVGISVFFRVIGLPGAGKVFMALVLIVFLLENNGAVFANLEAVGSGAGTGAGAGGTAGGGSSSGTQPAAPGGGSAPIVSMTPTPFVPNTLPGTTPQPSSGSSDGGGTPKTFDPLGYSIGVNK